MKQWVYTALRRPVGVIMALCALCTAAFYSLSRLSLSELPELSIPQLTVKTDYPGMGAEEIRSLVTMVVEDAVSSVRALERIRSVSREGESLVVLDFAWGTDMDQASTAVREAIDAVYPRLPEGAEKPLVVNRPLEDRPIAVISVSSRELSFARTLAEYELRSRLRKVEGVGAVVLCGGSRQEAVFRMDGPRAAGGGLVPADVGRILSQECADLPAGTLREGDRELTVVSAGRPASLGELGTLFFSGPGFSLRPSDLGNLRMEPARRDSVFIADGREQVALEVYRQPARDPVGLIRDIRRVVLDARRDFSRDADIQIRYEGSTRILKALFDLARSALIGVAAVFFILFLPIRSLRPAFLTALSIPVSAAAVVVILAVTHRSLNGMTLGGLALGIGLVSDPAVVVLEAIRQATSRFSARPSPPEDPSTGERPSPLEVGAGALSVASSSFGGMVTTLVVFVPIIFLPGPLGALYGDLALSVSVSVAAGWLYAQIALPSLYLFLYRPSNRSPHRKVLSVDRWYRRLLVGFLRRPAPLFGILILWMIGGTLLLFQRPLRSTVVPPISELDVRFDFPSGTPLERVAQSGEALAVQLAQVPGVVAVFGRSGAEPEDFGTTVGVDYRKEGLSFHCELAKNVVPHDLVKRIGAIGTAVGKEINQYSIILPQEPGEALLGLSKTSSFIITAADRQELARRVSLIEGELNNAAPPMEYTLKPWEKRTEIRLFPQRERLVQAGLSIDRIAETVRSSTEGVYGPRLEIDGRSVDLRLTASGSPSLEGISVIGPSGTVVALDSVASIRRLETDTALYRLDRQDGVYLDLGPSAVPGAPTVPETLDPGHSIPGLQRVDESILNRYRGSLVETLCLVLLLLYLTLASQFESPFLPLLLLWAIPFSLAGTGPLLAVLDAPMDSSAAVGLVILFGVAVNNGIVLYEHFQEKLAQGLSVTRAVYWGAVERLPAVLVTSGTTLCALMPVLLSPPGSPQRSLYAALAGGLVSSTFITIFALPVLFMGMAKRKGTP